MDLSSTPTAALKVLVEPDRVFVSVTGHPPLVMTHNQIRLRAAEARAAILAALDRNEDLDQEGPVTANPSPSDSPRLRNRGARPPGPSPSRGTGPA